MTALAVACGGALGAVARSLVTRTGWGWRATLATNMVGSLLLGLLIGVGPPEQTFAVVGVGACGAFTTMSSMALDATDQDGWFRWALPMAHLAAGLAAAAAGIALAS